MKSEEKRLTAALHEQFGSPSRRGLAFLAVCGATLALFATALAGKAPADVPIYGFDTTVSSAQAGGHPDVGVRNEIGTYGTEGLELCACNAIQSLLVQVPAGVVGIPTNMPQCTASELAQFACPTDSQVGVNVIRLYAPLGAGGEYFMRPLYNMEPRPGQLGLLAIEAPLASTPIYTVISARTESDYGLEFETIGIPRIFPPNEITQFTWGVPADPIHDELRENVAQCAVRSPLAEIAENKYPANCGSDPITKHSATAPPTPFLLNPTSCSGPLTATLDTVGYEFDARHAESPWPATTGCDQLSFDPSLSAAPTTEEADSPSGLDVDLEVPQLLSPDALSPSEIRGTTVTLPPGLTINPSVADGKTSCSDIEARFGTREQAICPEFAKIATLEIVSSALPASLPGYVYLGEPLPGNRYRVFLVADGFSVHLKLPGVATPDPKTGQLSISFKDLPESPFQEFDIHFFGAEKGILATPTQCGTYPVVTEFEPWASALPNQTSTQFFEIDSGPGGSPCPPAIRPFAPSVDSGVTDNTGGSHTSFGLQLSRKDGDQNLTSVDITLPPGLAGSLKGIPYCSEAALQSAASASAYGVNEQSSPSCPASSQLGTSSAAAGAGSRPIWLPGKAYLAGPYKGAPLSIAVITPAVAGPYDLGNVVVRVALDVDKTDTHITAISDPLPQIIEGIPLRLRNVLVEVNRPGFMLNPTNCSPFAINTLISGDQGAKATTSNHFQVANCGALPYSPKLSLKLTGGLNRLGHPAVHADFKAGPGEANTSLVSVALPEGEQLDQAHIGNVCTRVQFKAQACPANSVLGKATARTPLLDDPLKGNVYLRSGDNKLPDLVMDLRGQLDIELVGRIDTVRDGSLRTSFETVPDAPVSSFSLDLAGGSKGLLINSASLCKAPKKASTRMIGQNGAILRTKTKLQVNCKGQARKKKKRQSRSRRGA